MKNSLFKNLSRLGLIVVAFAIVLASTACTKTATESVEKEKIKEESVDEKSAKLYSQALDKSEEYDYKDDGIPAKEYKYAIVKMSGDDISQLLIGKNTEFGIRYIKVFSYDKEADKLVEPSEILQDGVGSVGGFRGALDQREDGQGLDYNEAASGRGEMIQETIKIKDGDIVRERIWEGTFDEMETKEKVKTKPIQWTDVSDRSQIDALAGKKIETQEKVEESDFESKTSSVKSNGDNGNNGLNSQIQAEKKAGRIVLTGRVKVLKYNEVLKLQGMKDPNAGYSDTNEEFVLLQLNSPQKISIKSSGDSSGKYWGGVAKLISIGNGARPYNGQTVTISISPDTTYWPSDTSLPLKEPRTEEIKILDGKIPTSAVSKNKTHDNNISANDIKNTDQVIRAKNTNMRADHSKNSAIVKTLLSGTRVHVSDTYVESADRIWCKVTYDGVTGWVSYNTMNGKIK